MNTQKTSENKRTNLPLDVKKTNDFIRDWERLSRSGKHDMNMLKETMMLLIANDVALPPEYKDHKLKGEFEGMRECHIKGDLLLVYWLKVKAKNTLITFLRVGTHSEIF